MVRVLTLTLNPALDITVSCPAVLPTEKLRCSEPRLDPGGGGINVARMLGIFGEPARALFPSGGPNGAAIEALLAAEDVAFTAVPIRGVTRESFTANDRASGLQYRFVLPGPTLVADEQARLIDELAAVADAAYIVVSGSLPPGVDVVFFERLGAVARRTGARIILDMNGAALAISGAAGAWLAKPNLDELREATRMSVATPADELAAVHALRARGVAEGVLVSLGERGALLVREGIVERIAAPRVETVSAVGAGDSMVAALIFALLRGWPLAEAARYGVAAGSAALLTPGTELARPAEVERLYRRIGRAEGRHEAVAGDPEQPAEPVRPVPIQFQSAGTGGL